MKIHLLVNRALRLLLLAMPVIVIPYLNDSFSLPKVTVLRLSCLFIVCAASAACIWRWKFKVTITPLHLPVICYTVWAFFRTVYSIHPALSWQGLYTFYFAGFSTLLCYISVFHACADAASDNKGESLIDWIIAGILCAVLAGAVQFIMLNMVRENTQGFVRIYGTMGNPNFLGALVIVAIPVLLCRALEKPAWHRVPVFLWAVFVLGATFTRSAWAGAVAGTAVLFACLARKRKKQAVAVLIIGLSAAAAGLALMHFVRRDYGTAIMERVFSSAVMDEENIASRLSGYRSTLSMAEERPWTGWGIDTHSLVFRRFMEKDYTYYSGYLAQAGYPHNELMEKLAESGLVGLGLWIWIWVTAFRMVIMRYRNTGKLIFAALCGVLAGVAVNNMFSFSVLSVQCIIWCLFGIIAGQTGKQYEFSLPALSPAKKYMFCALIAAVFLAVSVRIASVFAAEIYFSRGIRLEEHMPEEAQHQYRHAFTLNPTVSVYGMNLGRLLMKRAGQSETVKEKIALLESAYHIFTAVRKHNPHHALAYNGEGSSAAQLYRETQLEKWHESALDALEKAQRLDPFLIDAFINEALISEYARDYARAEASYRRALEIDTRSVTARFNLGCILANRAQESGQWDLEVLKEALEHWRAVLAVNPQHMQAKQYADIAQKELLGYGDE